MNPIQLVIQIFTYAFGAVTEFKRSSTESTAILNSYTAQDAAMDAKFQQISNAIVTETDSRIQSINNLNKVIFVLILLVAVFFLGKIILRVK